MRPSIPGTCHGTRKKVPFRNPEGIMCIALYDFSNFQTKIQVVDNRFSWIWNSNPIAGYMKSRDYSTRFAYSRTFSHNFGVTLAHT